MKKVVFALFLIGIIAGLILSHPYFNGKNPLFSYYHHLLWGDVLKIELDDNLDESKVTIIFENEMAMSQSHDSIRFLRLPQRIRDQLKRKVIYQNGTQVQDIPYDYGKQRLLVFYDGKRVGYLGHWKTNGYHSHRYIIKLSKVDDAIYFTGDIQGPDDRIKSAGMFKD